MCDGLGRVGVVDEVGGLLDSSQVVPARDISVNIVNFPKYVNFLHINEEAPQNSREKEIHVNSNCEVPTT
jgi:hypothetical protein